MWAAFAENAMQIPEARLCNIPRISLKLRAALQTISVVRELLILSTEIKRVTLKNYILENKLENFCYKNLFFFYLILAQ